MHRVHQFPITCIYNDIYGFRQNLFHTHVIVELDGNWLLINILDTSLSDP